MSNYTYIKSFDKKEQAYGWMKMKNSTNRIKDQLYCMVDGPDGDYIVCDLMTAIELGSRYGWSV